MAIFNPQATKLQTARQIGGVPFDGSANINLPGVNAAGNQSTTGNAATATQLSTASGSAPSYAARAWANWNGTGTVALRASGNVSSITDLGAGFYVMNFTTALPDTNYAYTVGFNPTTDPFNTSFTMGHVNSGVKSTTQLQMQTTHSSGVMFDFTEICVAVFR